MLYFMKFFSNLIFLPIVYLALNSFGNSTTRSPNNESYSKLKQTVAKCDNLWIHVNDKETKDLDSLQNPQTKSIRIINPRKEMLNYINRDVILLDLSTNTNMWTVRKVKRNCQLDVNNFKNFTKLKILNIYNLNIIGSEIDLPNKNYKSINFHDLNPCTKKPILLKFKANSEIDRFTLNRFTFKDKTPIFLENPIEVDDLKANSSFINANIDKLTADYVDIYCIENSKDIQNLHKLKAKYISLYLNDKSNFDIVTEIFKIKDAKITLWLNLKKKIDLSFLQTFSWYRVNINFKVLKDNFITKKRTIKQNKDIEKLLKKRNNLCCENYIIPQYFGRIQIGAIIDGMYKEGKEYCYDENELMKFKTKKISYNNKSLKR